MPVLMIATYNEDGTVNVMNAARGTMRKRDTVVLNLTETHKTQMCYLFYPILVGYIDMSHTKYKSK